MSKSMLLINGSSRKNGTSASFSMSLKNIAQKKEIYVEEIAAIDYLNNKYEPSYIDNVISTADIIGIITPLYIDTLPYSLIYFLEEIAVNNRQALKKKAIYVIAQSGFPNPKVMDPIVSSIELFALENDMVFLGGIRYGGGVIINGAKVESLGKRGNYILKNFDIMLTDIIKLSPISEDTKSNLDNKVASFLYKPLAMFMNHSTKKNARRNNINPYYRVY